MIAMMMMSGEVVMPQTGQGDNFARKCQQKNRPRSIESRLLLPGVRKRYIQELFSHVRELSL